MLILGLLGMYFDAVVVFVTSQTLLFRLALAILCPSSFSTEIPHGDPLVEIVCTRRSKFLTLSLTKWKITPIIYGFLRKP